MKKLSLFFVLLATAFHLCFAKLLEHPTANISSTWIIHDVPTYTVVVNDELRTVKPILVRGASTPGPKYACGFFCYGHCSNYLFSVFIVVTDYEGFLVDFSQVVWSSNRDSPVSFKSTMQLTSDGDLVLTDAAGTSAWSTNTSGKSVVGMNMTEIGNLVLYNSRNEMVWQSFDHPADALVPGQKLFHGQRLTSSTSIANWSRGLFSLLVSDYSLSAFIEADPPQAYYQSTDPPHSYYQSNPNPISKGNGRLSYVELRNGSLVFHYNGSSGIRFLYIPKAPSAQYIKLESDGHLKSYVWRSGKGVNGGWGISSDILSGNNRVTEAGYPMVCGEYGLYSNGYCSCPVVTNNETNFFELLNVSYPNQGCRLRSPLSCAASKYHELLEFRDYTYFSLIPDVEGTDIETCRKACLRTCSCKAAFFRYDYNLSNGSCSLPSILFSMINRDKRQYVGLRYNSTAFVKIQGIPPAKAIAPTRRGKLKKKVIAEASVGAFFGLFLLVGLPLLLIGIKRKDVDEEEYLDQVPGMPTRFSYEELKIATEDFMEKLGEGGFGSVFKGKLSNGTQVAVKLLDGVGQVKKSFFAEVETIGSLHHINLVALIGFCAEKSHRGLIYEYMPNGSLEKWIFKPTTEKMLGWWQRRKIISDIAKGLSYLHEDCRHKILHLDIKPQNILLDEKFTAKVSDFGLSKLIDKDKSNVMTTMRGTPGYMAPEWLNSVITEKVDVYSFGIVVLEILCGRKNLDHSQADEEMHLLSLFKRKGEENSLFELVDKCSQDMQLNGEEVVEMMKAAAWCLQSDFTKRPSMSVVVKVLEGGMDIDKSVDFKFVTTAECFKPKRQHDDTKGICGTSAPVPLSVLSGPR